MWQTQVRNSLDWPNPQDRKTKRTQQDSNKQAKEKPIKKTQGYKQEEKLSLEEGRKLKEEAKHKAKLIGKEDQIKKRKARLERWN